MARVLLVDDEPGIRKLTKMMLQMEGHNVDFARNGTECLGKLGEKKPDFILLDVMLPGENGWDICRKIKRTGKTKKIPVAMFTVRTSEEDQENSKEAGADAHINKPFTMEDLLATVRRLSAA